MVFPNVSEVLTDFLQSTTKKVVTVTTVDFEKVETVVSSTIDAVIQVADPRKLKVEKIDWSLGYIQVHSVSELAINNRIVWQGKDYKVIQLKNYSDYGYYEAVGEEVSRG